MYLKRCRSKIDHNSSSDSLNSKGSTTSSIAKRARKLISIPVKPKLSVSGDGPPLPAQDVGFEWKKQFSGRWLEVRIGKKSDSKRQVPASLSEDPPAPNTTPAADFATTVRRSNFKGPTPLPFPKPSQMYYSPPLPSNNPKASSVSTSLDQPAEPYLANRKKRFLGYRTPLFKSSRSVVQAGSNGNGRTIDTLNRASSALRDLVEKNHLVPSSSSTSTSNLSIAAHSSTNRKSRLTPSFRRPQGQTHSSSSSIRNMRMGKPPAGTPDSEDMYTGPNNQKYMRIDLTDPNGPAYLPSEARRIGTPPLRENGRHRHGRHRRGFFFDYNAPSSDPERSSLPVFDSEAKEFQMRPTANSSNNVAKPPRSPSVRIQMSDEDINWFRVRVALEKGQDEKERFELNVPEHLPSSPLCPRHPKHKSGGKGVCVYHGRNKWSEEE
ncbi:MAG: hypothetical protein LQ351_003832 [Letrouitia transgressa]|nr:MAG: hypothetical protein LQ351_003832 [Letrouitia transgressa]